MKANKFQISNLINMENPLRVLDEVNNITLMIYPDFDFKPIFHVFKDIENLYKGKYPGYRECNTRYHDIHHVTDALIAFVRLVHGATINNEPLSKANLRHGIIATLMHDTGYIQTADDTTGTGAKYTQTHIERSIVFLETYFSKNSYSDISLKNCCDMLNCTGLNAKIKDIDFSSPEIEMLGKMLGTADMLGQMADRNYLEKLQFLYHEFKEANIDEYENELDLLQKTIGFYEFTKNRLSGELDNMTRHLTAHFKARFGIDENLYETAMENNMKYLQHILKNHSHEYRKMLRRGGLVNELEQKGL